MLDTNQEKNKANDVAAVFNTVDQIRSGPAHPLPSSRNMLVRVVGKLITLSCPCIKVNRTKSNMALVKCVNNTMVYIEELGCTRKKEMVVRKGEGCGQISELGFQLGRELAPLVTMCRAKQGEVTYFTNHTMLGHLLHTRKVQDYRPNFKEGRLYFQGVSASSAYKQS